MRTLLALFLLMACQRPVAPPVTTADASVEEADRTWGAPQCGPQNDGKSTWWMGPPYDPSSVFRNGTRYVCLRHDDGWWWEARPERRGIP